MQTLVLVMMDISISVLLIILTVLLNQLTVKQPETIMVLQLVMSVIEVNLIKYHKVVIIYVLLLLLITVRLIKRLLLNVKYVKKDTS